MANKKPSKTSRDNLSRIILNRRKLTFLSAFILVAVCGFVGGKYTGNSNAAGNTGYYCPFNTYFQYGPPYHYQVCVSEIQTMLNSVGPYLAYSGHQNIATDGDFGPQTAGQVEAFARGIANLYSMQPSLYEGSVLSYPQGPGTWSTWRVLCGYYYAIHGANSVWNQTGCDRIPLMPFN